MTTHRKQLEREGFNVGKTRESKKTKKGLKGNGSIICSCDEIKDSIDKKYGGGTYNGDKCKCSLISGVRSVRVAQRIADNPTADLESLGSETRIPTRSLSGIRRVYIGKK